MSLLDRVTKAVGDAVDRGKKEVDQFVRIQKINGEIGDMERSIADFRNQIQEARQQAGEKAIEMLRAGTLACPDLQNFVDKVGGIEQQIASEEAAISGKRAEIERIKAEHEEAKTDAAAAPVVPPPIPDAAETPAAAPPAPAPSARFCPQCGAQLSGGGAFCPQCGAKIG